MKLVRFLILSISVIMFTSCNQKRFDDEVSDMRGELYIEASYDLPWHILYENGTDWQSHWVLENFHMTYESLRPNIPAGLRVVVYNSIGQIDMFNLPALGGRIDLNPGLYSILLYNNDFEYLQINESNEAHFITATTRARSRDNYTGIQFVDRETNENTLNTPDMLFAHNGGEFECQLTDNITLNYQLKPLVYKYVIRYHFEKGMQHVALARGSLAGMASTVYLSDGHTDENRCTLLYDINVPDEMYFSDETTGYGIIQTVVNTFGVPGFPNEYYTRAEGTYGLELEVRLKNGVIKTYDFDITSQINKQPRGGVIDVFGIEVTDDDAMQYEGSFDVEIDGWGPHQEIPII